MPPSNFAESHVRARRCQWAAGERWAVTQCAKAVHVLRRPFIVLMARVEGREQTISRMESH
jgi:hypothetical protein